MLNVPVAIFAHPLYHLVQDTVRKSELVLLLIGVAVLWSYIGWHFDTRNPVPNPRTKRRILTAVVGCTFGVVVLIEAITTFHAGVLYRFIAICWSVLMLRHFILLLRTSPAVLGTDKMPTGWRLPRITLVRVALSWIVFLVIGALALPPIDSTGAPNAALNHGFAVCGAFLLLLTIYAVVAYFMTAWRKIGMVPNRSSYVVWVGFETGLALSAVAAVLYVVVRR